jgi:starch phosphorylase
MNILGRISVFPKLPENISRLQELAYNLWWSWNPDAQALFSSLDEELWRSVNQNPVKFLRSARQELLNRAAADNEWLARFAAVLADFDAYMHPSANTWYRRTHADPQSPIPTSQSPVIAYFSAEFGLHEALPIYSGGLGILSGDHCKEASDLGLPFVGIGFLYPQGYFTQRITGDGAQEALYEKLDFSEVPATPALTSDGKPVLIHVDLPGRTVYAKVWRIQVGRIPLYLMDTDVERNAPQDRELSARLYGGDQETRISQEMVLGIGGVRMLERLGIRPSVFHANEGHAAFQLLERVRNFVQSGMSFNDAVEQVKATTIFTTHTPVPAGHDAFPFWLVEKHFAGFWEEMGLDREQFLMLGGYPDGFGGMNFNMTALSLRLTGVCNGVSKLHGHVSRQMWQPMWPEKTVDEVPITHVTNGVHTPTWIAPRLDRLFSKYLGPDWLQHHDEPALWERLRDLPDEELWNVHQQLKNRLFNFMRERARRGWMDEEAGPIKVLTSGTLLNPTALTIGFARRFATYKRALLIFRQLERLKHILHDEWRPVQIIFAGKAHPADNPGKNLIHELYNFARDNNIGGRVAFIENYDIHVAKYFYRGVDIWLNNPRRPLEASGTSGQKAALNGVPHLSVLDGWWYEGYQGTNGWAIGEEREYKDTETQDEADALSFYTTLEEEMIPLFFERDGDGVPQGWLEKMRRSIATCAPQFSMRRMVKEYTERLYVAAMTSGVRVAGNDYATAYALADWKRRVRDNWFSVNLQILQSTPAQVAVGDTFTVSAKLWPGLLSANDLAVELVAGQDAGADFGALPIVIPMQPSSGHGDGSIDYQGTISPQESGRLAVGVRVRPNHAGMIHPYEVGLARWV